MPVKFSCNRTNCITFSSSPNILLHATLLKTAVTKLSIVSNIASPIPKSTLTILPSTKYLHQISSFTFRPSIRSPNQIFKTSICFTKRSVKSSNTFQKEMTNFHCDNHKLITKKLNNGTITS